MGILTSLAVTTADGAVAAARRAAPCDGACAQAEVHSPGRATTVSVAWTRYPYTRQKKAAAIDPWGTVERQCTGYVAWTLNKMGIDFGMRDRAPDGRVVSFTAAARWAAAARRGGWTVSHRPVVGSVAQWRANEISRWTLDGVAHSATAGPDGHVAIVSRVFGDGTVLVHQFNAGRPGRTYSTMRLRAPRYLDIGV